MLGLSRRVGTSLTLTHLALSRPIVIHFNRFRDRKVVLAIDAPEDVIVLRDDAKNKTPKEQ